MLTCQTPPLPGRPSYRGGRLRQNGGRLQIGMLDGIRSEWWAPSDQNAWTASVRIRTSPSCTRRFLATPSAGHFEIDAARIAEDARFDGLYVSRTNSKLKPCPSRSHTGSCGKWRRSSEPRRPATSTTPTAERYPAAPDDPRRATASPRPTTAWCHVALISGFALQINSFRFGGVQLSRNSTSDWRELGAPVRARVQVYSPSSHQAARSTQCTSVERSSVTPWPASPVERHVPGKLRDHDARPAG